MRTEFQRYKARFVDATCHVLAKCETEKSALDEAAFPAYANSNALISFLFWSRVRYAMQVVRRRGSLKATLDFGCGGGVMLPFLAQRASRVVAYDTDLRPLRAMSQRWPLAPNIAAIDANDHPLTQFADGEFELILSLDVLEHVEDLADVLGQFARILRRDGLLVVSGPTENRLYQLGRRLAGPEYSGDYHMRAMSDVEAALEPNFRVRETANLFGPLPLFRILSATPKPISPFDGALL